MNNEKEMTTPIPEHGHNDLLDHKENNQSAHPAIFHRQAEDHRSLRQLVCHGIQNLSEV